MSLVIIALGLNDFYNTNCVRTWASAQGIDRLLDLAANAPNDAGYPRPKMLVLAPPPIDVRSAIYGERFDGATERSQGLAEAYRQVAETKGAFCFNLGTVTTASAVDGVQLDEDQHERVASAVAIEAARILGL